MLDTVTLLRYFDKAVGGSTVGVGGIGVLVGFGVGVSVGGTAVRVGGTEVEGTGVEAGAHPLNKTVRNTNVRKTNPIDFFMTFSPFDLIMQGTAQR